MKTILVFSHVHNSFDKKTLIKDGENQYLKMVDTSVEEFVKEHDIFRFFMNDIDELLNNYDPGSPDNKPDVLKQIDELQTEREKKMVEHQHWSNSPFTLEMQHKMNQMNVYIQELTMENNILKDKNSYL